MTDSPFDRLLSIRARETQEPPISFLMKRALDDPDIISLAAGFVDQESLPAEFARSILDELMSDPAAARAALQYGSTIGRESVRRRVAERLERDGVPPPADPDHVVIGNGSQQLLFIATDCLVDRGDIVLVEDPTYFVYLGVLNNIGARVMGVPTDGCGMRADALRARLQSLERSGEISRLKILYLQTYYQNPMGTNISAERRAELWDVIEHFVNRGHEFVVFEDAAYRDLRYDGPDVPYMAHLDPTGRRIAVFGTFSKAFSPGLRLGWAYLPDWMTPHVLRQKGNHDFGTCNFTQTMIEMALDRGLYDRQVERLRGVYRDKAARMIRGIREFLPPDARIVEPQGGLYVWVELPADCPTGPDSALFEAALRHKVLYVPGRYCFCQEPGVEKPDSGMRLTYAMMPPDTVHEGLRRLGRAIEETRTGAAVR
ncbi:MAG: PLP-dependent aminotransferase family protein [Candidatus Sumerlaeia bacterium]